MVQAAEPRHVAGIRISPIALSWGSTPIERSLPFGCDRVLPDADFVLYRAVTVESSAPVVFRWLCQLRAAPYSYDWLDNLGSRSPSELTPGLDELALGQRIMTIFALVGFEPETEITVRIARERPRALFGDVAITYKVIAVGDAISRLVAKLRVDQLGKGPLAELRKWAFAWGDLVMMRKQLLTLKAYAGRAGDATVSP
jgi:hypothetical protein